MTERDLLTQLREEEAARHAAGMPDAAREAVRRRLRSAGSRPTIARPRWLIPVAIGALVLAVMGGIAMRMVKPSVTSLGGFAVTDASKDLRIRSADDGVEVASGSCTLIDEREGLAVKPLSPLVLRREGGALRIVRGTAEITVQRRPPTSQPAIVEVSGGSIEVTSTRFTVAQEAAEGTVTLHEGSIRFRPRSGPSIELAAGESLHWPIAPALSAPPAPAPPIPVPEPERSVSNPRAHAGVPSSLHSAPPPQKPVSPPVRSIEDVLDEVEALRSQHRYDDAVRALESAMQAQPEASRERLSFELGSILSGPLQDRRRACAHWDAHLRHFGPGHYAHEIRAAQARLGCASTGEGP